MIKYVCDMCGTELIKDCGLCGAPMCCPACCQITTLEANLNAATARAEQVEASVVEQLRSYDKPGFLGDVNDPVYMEALRIENMGFEGAHQLRECGHSRGDYQDARYGTPEYAGDERCVGCDRESVLAAQLETARRALEFYADEENWDTATAGPPGESYGVPYLKSWDSGEHARAALATITASDGQRVTADGHVADEAGLEVSNEAIRPKCQERLDYRTSGLNEGGRG